MSSDDTPSKKTKTLTLPEYLYDFFVQVASKPGPLGGRSPEKLIEAVLVKEMIHRRGGSSGDAQAEYDRIMGITLEEEEAFADEIVKTVRREAREKREAQETSDRTEKGDFDA